MVSFNLFYKNVTAIFHFVVLTNIVVQSTSTKLMYLFKYYDCVFVTTISAALYTMDIIYNTNEDGPYITDSLTFSFYKYMCRLCYPYFVFKHTLVNSHFPGNHLYHRYSPLV